MKYAIYIFAILSLWHFAYEAILLPSIRLCLRFRLFVLRDRLRWLKVQYDKELSNEVFEYLQGGINNWLRLLPYVDFELVLRVHEAIEADGDLKQRIESRAASVAACPVADAREICKAVQKVAEDTLSANSGAWTIYLLPLALAARFLASIKRKVQQLVSLPEADVDRVVQLARPSLAFA